MNIIEAFKASNYGKIKRRSWSNEEAIKFKSFTISAVDDVLAEDWEPVNEYLTFERIKKECVAGKTLLVDEHSRERLYLGFNREGRLVTDCWAGQNSTSWRECDIKNWRIGGEWSGNEARGV